MKKNVPRDNYLEKEILYTSYTATLLLNIKCENLPTKPENKKGNQG